MLAASILFSPVAGTHATWCLRQSSRVITVSLRKGHRRRGRQTALRLPNAAIDGGLAMYF